MPRSGSRTPRQRAEAGVLQLPEEQWAQLQAVLSHLSTIDGTDSIAEDDFGIALELCQIDASSAWVRSLTRKCLADDGRVDFVAFLEHSRVVDYQPVPEPETEPQPEPEQHPRQHQQKEDKHFSSERPGASSRWQRTAEQPSSLNRERSASIDVHRTAEQPSSLDRARSASIDVYQPGDLVEYNSITLGGWANAVVGKVYPHGELQLLGDPGPGATRQQIAAAKGHVLKDGADPARVRRRSARRKVQTKPGGLNVYAMEDFELGKEIAAGASCKVRRGSIQLDGTATPLAVKVFVWNERAVEDPDGDGNSSDGSDGFEVRVTSADAMAIALKARATAARANPVWLADRDHTTCMLGSKCQNVTFSLINPVHHCRYCGWVVCGNCRRQTLEVDRWVSSDTREIKTLVPPAKKLKAVCDSCFVHAPEEIRIRAARSQCPNDYESVRRKMRAEAEILHRCAHRNVVRVIGVCDTHPSLCLLLEWCPQGSLYDVLRKEREAHTSGGDMQAGSSRKSLPRLDATRLGYAQDVVRALAHLHGPSGGSTGRRGWAVAHRDVKSQNYLVAADGTVKLADLGDAQLESNSTSSVGGLLSSSAGGGGDSAMSPSDVMAAARTSVRAVGSAVVNLTAAAHREAAALAESTGATGLGGIIAKSAAGLGLNLGMEGEIGSVTAGTVEWMAPELLAATVPATWFEPDAASGSYVVDTQVPGLREAVADWPRSRWEIEDFCRGDVYGMGIVLWEIYTAAEPGAFGSKLQHIRAVCVDNRRPALPLQNRSAVAWGSGRAAQEAQSTADEYESWVKMCWDKAPASRPTAEEVLRALEYVAESVQLAASATV